MAASISELGSLASYLLLLLLPLAALFARRLPARQVAAMVLAWTAIFIVAMLILAGGAFSDVTRRFDNTSVSGSATTLTMIRDGHFIARAKVNGVARLMMIDTGATTTALMPSGSGAI